MVRECLFLFLFVVAPSVAILDSVFGNVQLLLSLSINSPGSNRRHWSRLWSGRVLSSFLFLVALSVGALYQGSIIAFLAVPRNTQPIDSAAHLMQRLDSVVPIVRKNTVYYNFIVVRRKVCFFCV